MDEPDLKAALDVEALRKALSGRDHTPATAPPPLDGWREDWQGWLKALHASVWETHIQHNVRHGPQRWSSEARRLTPEEWATLQEVLRTHKPICELHNACMGFGCGMAVYAEPPRVYPGADVRPEFLLDVTKDHLPLTVCDLREPGERGADCRDRTFFEDGWRAFSPFTHHPDNARLLAAYGFESPKSKGYYDY